MTLIFWDGDGSKRRQEAFLERLQKESLGGLGLLSGPKWRVAAKTTSDDWREVKLKRYAGREAKKSGRESSFTLMKTRLLSIYFLWLD